MQGREGEPPPHPGNQAHDREGRARNAGKGEGSYPHSQKHPFRFQQPSNAVFATPGPRRTWRSTCPVGYPRPMRRRFSAVLLILAGCQGAAADFSARVVGISDGDTLTVLTADRRQVKVRLHGIDAPETGQDFGARAIADPDRGGVSR
jgi:endonuclease YncB( thermonuclease family)